MVIPVGVFEAFDHVDSCRSFFDELDPVDSFRSFWNT